MANTLGKAHGKLDLRLYNTGRWVECGVDKCYDHNTFIIHRGSLGWNPMFLCEDCLGDIVEAYVELVGKDKAKKTLAAALELLKDEEETPDAPDTQSAEDTPAVQKGTRKRAAAKDEA